LVRLVDQRSDRSKDDELDAINTRQMQYALLLDNIRGFTVHIQTTSGTQLEMMSRFINTCGLNANLHLAEKRMAAISHYVMRSGVLMPLSPSVESRLTRFRKGLEHVTSTVMDLAAKLRELEFQDQLIEIQKELRDQNAKMQKAQEQERILSVLLTILAIIFGIYYIPSFLADFEQSTLGRYLISEFDWGIWIEGAVGFLFPAALIALAIYLAKKYK
jgi:hypothetical protein